MGHIVDMICSFFVVNWSTWLSTLSGKEIDSDLLTSLRDGIVGD